MVVLYGGHLSPEHLPLIVTEEKWETPFGDIEVHTEFVKSLMKRVDTKKESPESGDNTMEVQLAMVKYFFPEAKLLALRSPSSLRARELGEAVGDIARKEGTSVLSVGSTDLTHYGPNYGFLSKGVGPRAVEWVKKENDSAGAMGLFQVMPFHFRAGENPYNPNTNALRGLNYLTRALTASHRNVRLALAGYNGGIGIVSRGEWTWSAQTLRYVYYGAPIYEDAQNGSASSPKLKEWYKKYGAGLCRQASKKLGLE